MGYRKFAAGIGPLNAWSRTGLGNVEVIQPEPGMIRDYRAMYNNSESADSSTIREFGTCKKWRRGGIASVVAEREVRVGERWYVSRLQRGLTIRGDRQCLRGLKRGSNRPKLVARLVARKAAPFACPRHRRVAVCVFTSVAKLSRRLMKCNHAPAQSGCPLQKSA
jgi:hypothetical protein